MTKREVSYGAVVEIYDNKPFSICQGNAPKAREVAPASRAQHFSLFAGPVIFPRKFMGINGMHMGRDAIACQYRLVVTDAPQVRWLAAESDRRTVAQVRY